MQLTSILYVFTLAFTVCASETTWFHYNHDYYVYYGCSKTYLSAATFCSGKAAKCLCTNKNGLASMLYCGYKYTHVNNTGYNADVREVCEEYTNKTSDEYYAEIYQYALDNIVNITSNKSFNTSEVVKYPLYSKKIFAKVEDYIITGKHRYGNIFVSHMLGCAFIGATVLLFLVSGAINWTMRFSKSFATSIDSSFTRQFRKFVNMKIFKNHLQPTIAGLNPDAVETFWIFIFFVSAILSNCIIGFQWYVDDVSFKTYQAGTSRYWGDRSGVLLSYRLPLVFLFAGRNNIFQWITRWKYSRFMAFHRWVARITMAEVLIHSFAMASQTYALKKWTRFGTDWYRYGIVSTVAGCLACTVAIFFIRNHWYEIFLITHIVFVAMFLWTGYLHALSQDYEGFYWFCIALWIFERFIRVVRITMNGIQTASVEYFPGDDAVYKLSIKKPRFHKTVKPGSHVFISFLTKKAFWQNHPFTVYESVEDSEYMTLVCRVKKGVTKRIGNLFHGCENLKIDVKILIDGFYGEQSYYQQYDKAVFITANTGVSGPFSHVKKLTSSDSNTKVELYWGIRSYDSLKWLAPELLSLKGTNCVPKIYISQPDKSAIVNSSSSASDSDHKEDNDSEKKSDVDSIGDAKVQEVMEFVKIYHGRMPVAEIIDNELKDNSGNVAFGACAHPQVVDTVRKEVANRLSSYEHRLEYFEEMQAW